MICLKDKLTRYLNEKTEKTSWRMFLGTKIELILNALSDGEWHGIVDLQRLTELDEVQIQEMAAFLFEYDLARVDFENKKVKVKQDFHNFLVQTPTS